jgi:3-isopropylmalate dehydrogenase
MLLRYSLQLEHEAAVVERAVEEVIDEGLRTADIAPAGTRAVGTREMADAVIDAVKTLSHGSNLPSPPSGGRGRG